MSIHKHAFDAAKQVIKDMKPLPELKNPYIAAIVGFFFGFAGVAIYFKSWKDFWICLLMLIVLSILIPGLGEIPGWLFSPAYAFYRAKKSNEQL